MTKEDKIKELDENVHDIIEEMLKLYRKQQVLNRLEEEFAEFVKEDEDDTKE